MARWEDDNVHTPRVRVYGRVRSPCMCLATALTAKHCSCTRRVVLLGLALAACACHVRLVRCCRAARVGLLFMKLRLFYCGRLLRL